MLDTVPTSYDTTGSAAALAPALRQVVVVADFGLSKGGAENVAIDSARALAETGVDVTFIFAIGSEADARLNHPRIRPIGLGFPDLWQQPRLVAAQAGVWHVEAARRLTAALETAPKAGSIVHMHQWTRGYSPSAFQVLLRSGRPLAVTMHGYYTCCPTGILYRYDTHSVCKLKPGSLACTVANCDPFSMAHKAVRVARTWSTHYALAGASFDAIHVSDRGLATLSAQMSPNVRQHRVDNPVRVKAGPAATIADDAAFAYIGRMTTEKGAEAFAAATRLAGVKAIVIGEGPSEAAVRRLNPDAELLGWRSSAEVMELLRTRIRCVVAPALWPETGPLTVYEAMAAGVTVIATNLAGSGEKITDGETGFVCEPTPEELAAAMRRLTDIDLARRMGAAAYERYWQHPLSPEAHAIGLLGVYAGMLSRQAEGGKSALPVLPASLPA